MTDEKGEPGRKFGERLKSSVHRRQRTFSIRGR